MIFIIGELGVEALSAAGLKCLCRGHPQDYVITFFLTGLWLTSSGDTGVTAEQQTVVAGQYGAELVVMNIGDTFTTGPTRGCLCHQ